MAVKVEQFKDEENWKHRNVVLHSGAANTMHRTCEQRVCFNENGRIKGNIIIPS